jgi:hypothetical protein
MEKLISLLLFMSYYFAKSQTPESLLEKVQLNYSPEKIYVHFDKTNYVAGETIWFKAYLMDGFLPSKKSTVFSIELLNELGVIVQKKNLSVNGSASIGQFETDKSLPQGNYTVRAFTRNLMNFGTDNFYYAKLEIYNPTSIILYEKKVDEPIIQFLPESGNFVANVKNNVAFVCTDMQGKPLDISGKIIDDKGKEIVSFNAVHNGMGILSFVPSLNMKYTANCIIEKEYKKNVLFPIPMQGGVIVTISRKGEKMFFEVDASSVKDENMKPSYILGVQESAVTFKAPLQENLKMINGEIPVSSLPTGILQITVFNKANKPLAERLVFVNSEDYKPKDKLSLDRIGLGARALNSYTYSIDDTLIGTFSVSVTEVDGEAHKNENIVSRFLLTNDIKGYVHDPNYYFEAKDEEREKKLDLVMLTNGWRKYSWAQMNAGNYPSMNFKDPNYISIFGDAKNRNTKELLKNVELKAIVKTKDKQIDYANFDTDKDGKFEFSGLNFEDTATFAFKNSNLYLDFKSEPIERLLTVAKSNLPKLFELIPASNSIVAKTKNRYYKNVQSTKGNAVFLDEVIVKSKVNAKKKEEEKKRSSQFGSSANKTLDMSNEPPSNQNIFDYLKSRLTGVTITGGPTDYFINYRNTRTLLGGQLPMSVFLDGFAVDPSQIATLRADNVTLVQVYSNAQSPNSGGTLAIFTGEKANFAPGGGSYNGVTALLSGFSPTKEFFSPNYANDYDNSTVKSDERTTLYWNPYLNTNAQNKSFTFSFYNSDIAKKFKIVLEGVLEDGRLVHVEKVVE